MYNVYVHVHVHQYSKHSKRWHNKCKAWDNFFQRALTCVGGIRIHASCFLGMMFYHWATEGAQLASDQPHTNQGKAQQIKCLNLTTGEFIKDKAGVIKPPKISCQRKSCTLVDCTKMYLYNVHLQCMYHIIHVYVHIMYIHMHYRSQWGQTSQRWCTCVYMYIVHHTVHYTTKELYQHHADTLFCPHMYITHVHTAMYLVPMIGSCRTARLSPT